mgnify:CR=1 FL=1
MDILQIYNSDFARSMGTAGSLVALGGAIIFFIYAMTLYGRAKDSVEQADIPAPWGLLMATWRDSLIITLLFMCESLVYRASAFTGWSQSIGTNPLGLTILIEPVAALMFNLVVAYICIVRILKIRDWMKHVGLER